MKRSFLTLMTFIFSINLLLAQVPQKMSYQAVIRNADQSLVSNQLVSVRISILQGSASGNTVYSETHELMTNINGLVSLVIGEGENQNGAIQDISWGLGPYYIMTETDPNGGTDYSISGTAELISVPYALFAQEAVTSGSSGGGGDSDWVEDVVADEVYTERNISLKQGGNDVFKVFSNSAPLLPRVFVTNDSEDGIFTTSDQGIGIHSESQDNYGVFSVSENNHGIYAETHGSLFSGIYGEGLDKSYGVIGSSGGDNLSGILGEGFNNAYGVRGTAEGKDVSGVLGQGFQESTGVIGESNALNLSGVLGDGLERAIGVKGISVGQKGVRGESESNDGVFGFTEAEVQEILLPNLIGNGTNQHAGISGNSIKAYGGFVNSDEVSGLVAVSQKSNGVTATSKSSDKEKAGVYGATENTNGVYGRSINYTGVWGKSNSEIGVRGSSESGAAGQFEGEVRIVNGMKKSDLYIEELKPDNTAKVMVWNEGDKYVKVREGWTIGGPDDAYFVSNKGIIVRNGDEDVFRVNPNGTSYHKGLEIFDGGLIVPSGDVQLRMIPGDGISVYNPSEDQYLWHANTSGNSFAAQSFFAESISCTNFSAAEKNFKIDHPLYPEDYFLVHTSIESDERLNVYSGNITTDKEGIAKVTLPEWFEALNTDFRYQLTVIGSFARAVIWEEVNNGTFTIKSDMPDTKVSWQLTGVRHDTYAKNNPTRVVVPKEKLN